jgi:hypothetical protein
MVPPDGTVPPIEPPKGTAPPVPREVEAPPRPSTTVPPKEAVPPEPPNRPVPPKGTVPPNAMAPPVPREVKPPIPPAPGLPPKPAVLPPAPPPWAVTPPPTGLADWSGSTSSAVRAPHPVASRSERVSHSFDQFLLMIHPCIRVCDTAAEIIADPDAGAGKTHGALFSPSAWTCDRRKPFITKRRWTLISNVSV